MQINIMIKYSINSNLLDFSKDSKDQFQIDQCHESALHII